MGRNSPVAPDRQCWILVRRLLNFCSLGEKIILLLHMIARYDNGMPSANSSAPLLPPVLVMLPGLDGTGQLFRWFVAALPSSIKPVTVTFPPNACTYAEIQAHAKSCLPLNQPFILLGESFSGPLALFLAQANPDNLLGIVLTASFAAQPLGWASRFTRSLVRPFVFRLPGQATALRLLLLGRAPPAELVTATIDILKSLTPSVLAARVKAVLAVDASEALVRCPVPILYLGGRQDRLLSPAIRRRIHSLRPDTEIITLDAPHFLLQRAPAEAAQVVARFLFRQLSSLESEGAEVQKS